MRLQSNSTSSSGRAGVNAAWMKALRFGFISVAAP
jgi:hypothetical protein